jgi:hypothetical protein
MSWQKIGSGERLQPGEGYRMTLSVSAPYVAATTAAIRGAVYAKAVFSTGDFIVDRTDHAPPVMRSDGTLAPFPFWIYFHVNPAAPLQSGLDPRVIWSLAALVIGGLVALRIASVGIERLISESGEQTQKIIKTIGDTTKQTILNPMVLVAGLVGLWLWTRRA